jgi:tryptophan synthase alpha subunit
MRTIRETFHQHAPLFIPFIMAGHPTPQASEDAFLALARSGADIIELGIPFSDPIADGPINQEAACVALQQGMTLTHALDMIQRMRSQGITTPIIVFSYLNPILAMGMTLFTERAIQAGVSGVLLVDLPPEEGTTYYRKFKKMGLEYVLLVSKTTTPERITFIRDLDPCFIYYIARLSVTGVQSDLSTALQSEVETLRTQVPNLPIAVGFGISTCDHARIVAQFSDGVIVGSRLVKSLEVEGLAAFTQLAKELANAVHETS